MVVERSLKPMLERVDELIQKVPKEEERHYIKVDQRSEAVVTEGIVDLLRVDDHYAPVAWPGAPAICAVRRPGLQCVDFLHGLGHALVKGQQGFTDGCLGGYSR